MSDSTPAPNPDPDDNADDWLSEAARGDAIGELVFDSSGLHDDEEDDECGEPDFGALEKVLGECPDGNGGEEE